MSEITEVVVVGVDASACSDAAVKWADAYARATGATIRLVTVWQWAQSYGYPMMFEGYSPDADALAVAEKARAGLSVPAAQVEISTPEGVPGHELVKRSEGASLLVVGTHGHRGVNSLLLGSVSTYCVHHATCPVVVVR
jgi:nucleotide-binding universal stress UspA family protein